jgi:four helix bundle protein
MPRDPRKLHGYHRAHSLTLAVYKATQKLPKSEEFGLQSQLRRAAVSIVANIAEGASRPHARDYARFLGIALGSAVELRCLLDLVDNLGLLRAEDLGDCRELSDHVVRTLQKLQGVVSTFRDEDDPRDTGKAQPFGSTRPVDDGPTPPVAADR